MYRFGFGTEGTKSNLCSNSGHFFVVGFIFSARVGGASCAFRCDQRILLPAFLVEARRLTGGPCRGRSPTVAPNPPPSPRDVSSDDLSCRFVQRIQAGRMDLLSWHREGTEGGWFCDRNPTLARFTGWFKVWCRIGIAAKRKRE